MGTMVGSQPYMTEMHEWAVVGSLYSGRVNAAPLAGAFLSV